MASLSIARVGCCLRVAPGSMRRVRNVYVDSRHQSTTLSASCRCISRNNRRCQGSSLEHRGYNRPSDWEQLAGGGEHCWEALWEVRGTALEGCFHDELAYTQFLLALAWGSMFPHDWISGIQLTQWKILWHPHPHTLNCITSTTSAFSPRTRISTLSWWL
jgi:hypothetical protein